MITLIFAIVIAALFVVYLFLSKAVNKTTIVRINDTVHILDAKSGKLIGIYIV